LTPSIILLTSTEARRYLPKLGKCMNEQYEGMKRLKVITKLTLHTFNSNFRFLRLRIAPQIVTISLLENRRAVLVQKNRVPTVLPLVALLTAGTAVEKHGLSTGNAISFCGDGENQIYHEKLM
jgi:hypothetical protein